MRGRVRLDSIPIAAEQLVVSVKAALSNVVNAPALPHVQSVEMVLTLAERTGFDKNITYYIYIIIHSYNHYNTLTYSIFT